MFDKNDIIDAKPVKVKHQIVFELMYWRRGRLRALLEDIDFTKWRFLNRFQILHNAIEQLKQMSPADTRFLDDVEEQVKGVLRKYYNWLDSATR